MKVYQDKNLLDNTKVSTLKSCPRKFFIRHVCDITEERTTSEALSFGTSWHAGMDVIWKLSSSTNDLVILTEAAMQEFYKFYPEDLSLSFMEGKVKSQSKRSPATAREMFFAYLEKYHHKISQLKTVQVEVPFMIPIPGLEEIFYCGRLDKRVQLQDDSWEIYEHKTTSDYSRDYGFGYQFSNVWKIAAQVRGYQLQEYLKTGNQVTVYVDGSLVHAKERYFKQYPFRDSLEKLELFYQNLANWSSVLVGKLFTFEQTQSGVDIFPKNEEQCFGKYGQCEYLHLCMAEECDSLLEKVPVGYKRERWIPIKVVSSDPVNPGEQNGEC
jgi:hypothetical protein